MLSLWIPSFQLPVPPVLSTYEDNSLNAAISAIPDSNLYILFACVFYLFDMKVKKRLLPVLTASGEGASSWAGFRKGLRMIREAGDPNVIEEMWEDRLEEWIWLSDRTRSIRNYMYNYVWSKKKKCAAAYFEKLFTGGAINTQVSEGCHAELKQYANWKSLAGLFDSIHKLVARQHLFEIRKSRDESRTAELSTSTILNSSTVHSEKLLKIQDIYRTHA